MKNVVKSRIFHIGSIVLALLAMSLGHSAFAEGDRLGALDAKVSVVTKTTFVQGEPIILRYLTANVSDQRLGVSWGQTAGYTVSLTDQAGATNVVQQQITPARGLHLVPDPFMPVGSKRESYFTVPQRLISLYPGRYTLTVQVRLPYTTADENEENPLKIEQKVQASGTVFSRVFRFPLLITASNDSVLRATAASLLKTIVATPYGPECQADMEALFSMPESQAAASWKELVARSGSINEALIADKLGDVGSVKAADLLLKMLDKPSLSSDNSMFISEKLAQIYNSGSVSLRSHLQNTMMERGLEMPSKIAVSEVTD